jgi:hypothetical protein
VSLSLFFLLAWSVASSSAEPPAQPLSDRRSERAPESALPPDGAAPLEKHRSTSESDVPSEGAVPLEGPTPSTPESPDSTLLPDGLAPFDNRPGLRVDGPTPPVDAPLGPKPALAAPPSYDPSLEAAPIDPKAVRLVRLDLLFGPMWRIHRVDTMISTSAELGPMHGFSAAFHTAFIIDTQREVVRAIDVPLGFGVIARGRVRNRPLYGSVGLTAGILVHRAKTERGVIHRVDPDFRLPIRLAWTIATVGLSLVIEQGYSVRNRNYERRGVEVWERHAYRIGFAIGLHSDIVAGRAKRFRPRHRRSRRV